MIIIGYSCSKNDNQYKAQVAVDAWIEDGDFPYVFLTSTTQYESVIDSSVYFDVVLTRAKVTVTCEGKSEVLILFRNKKYFPQHFYRGNEMRGEVGKTYSLEIILNGDTITSKTTIPSKVEMQKVWYKNDSIDTTKGYIWVGVNDPASEVNNYRAFTKIVNHQYQYVATHLSVLEDTPFNGKYMEFPLYKGLESNTDNKFDYRFSRGDTVDVKISTMDNVSSKFWIGFEREMINSGNPFGPEGRNLNSNITGGIGIWCGYASSKYRIILK